MYTIRVWLDMVGRGSNSQAPRHDPCTNPPHRAPRSTPPLLCLVKSYSSKPCPVTSFPQAIIFLLIVGILREFSEVLRAESQPDRAIKWCYALASEHRQNRNPSAAADPIQSSHKSFLGARQLLVVPLPSFLARPWATTSGWIHGAATPSCAPCDGASCDPTRAVVGACCLA
jgi:hypothetical protein